MYIHIGVSVCPSVNTDAYIMLLTSVSYNVIQIYIRIYTYIYPYIHMYICIYVNKCMLTYTSIHMYIHIGVSVFPSVNTGAYIMLITAVSYNVIQIYIRIYTYIYPYIYPYIHMYICIYVNKCMLTYTYIHMYIHIGVSVSPSVNTGAYIMLITAVSYIVIQIPGIVYLHSPEQEQITGMCIYEHIPMCL
jgi:hypothetical protein